MVGELWKVVSVLRCVLGNGFRDLVPVMQELYYFQSVETLFS
jgi:hypothetical protein